jgi:hypothetical protein
MSLGYTIEMIIPIPHGYQETELSEKRKFALLELIYFPLEKEFHLDNFFVYSQLYLKEARSYEKKAFKGIGKIMLKNAIDVLFKEFVKSPRLLFDMKITLKAEGGSISQNFSTEYIIPYSKEYIMKYIRTNYPDNTVLYNTLDKESLDILRYRICEIEENKKLVQYYKTLGFKIVEDICGTSILMKGKLLDVLNRLKMSKNNHFHILNFI